MKINIKKNKNPLQNYLYVVQNFQQYQIFIKLFINLFFQILKEKTQKNAFNY
jgi:hypothetical protein